MADSIDELAFGKEYAEANRKFNDEMASLDDKHANVLGEGDTFKNYFVMTNNVLPGRVTFKIHDEENKVPLKIRREMEDIFRRNFDPSLRNKTQ